MTLTVQERKQRVEDSFAKISEDEATRSIVEELKGIAETEITKEADLSTVLSESAQVAEWEAFHDYVLERLDNEDTERLSKPATGRHCADDKKTAEVNEVEVDNTSVEAGNEKEDTDFRTQEEEKVEAVVEDGRLNAHGILDHEFTDKPKGYNKDQVDEALTELAKFLNRKKVTKEELVERLNTIASISFSQARMLSKGYDTDEVDHFLEKIEDELSKRLKSA